jgi:exodeoxyribonuclease VII large subunit
MEGLAFRVFQSAKERLHAEEIRIQHHGITVTQGTVQLLHVASNRLSRLRERINWSSQRLTADANRKLDDQFKLIKDSVSRRLERQQHQLLVIEAQMKNASPEKILSRGFAWLTAGDEILTSVHQLQPQTAITAHLKDGTAQLNVVQINKSQRDE